jgi:hypothetical protein
MIGAGVQVGQAISRSGLKEINIKEWGYAKDVLGELTRWESEDMRKDAKNEHKRTQGKQTGLEKIRLLRYQKAQL